MLLALVLMLAAALHWGSHRAEYYFERSYLAHDAAQEYLTLSHNTYRHFKELVDIVVFNDGDESIQQAKLSYEALRQSLMILQLVIEEEINHVDEEEL